MTHVPDYHYTLACLQLRELQRRELKRNEDRLFYALVKQTDALLDELRQYAKAGFKPTQPRVPAGNPDGGQWTRGGDSQSSTAEEKPSDSQVYTGAPDLPIEPVYPIEAAIGLAAGGGSVRRILGEIADILTNIGEVGIDEDISLEGSFKKPEGIPDNWIEIPSKKGTGIKYRDPSNAGNEVRIMEGKPNSKYTNSQSPYIRWMRNGQPLDMNGKPVPEKTPEAHIPLEFFKFNKDIFK